MARRMSSDITASVQSATRSCSLTNAFRATTSSNRSESFESDFGLYAAHFTSLLALFGSLAGSFYPIKKVKASHTRYRVLGPELMPVCRQSACR